MLRFISVLTLVAAFAFSAAASYIACYVVLVGLLLMVIKAGAWRDIGRPGASALLLALGAITLATLIAGPLEAGNWLGPLILLVPLLALGFPELGRQAPRFATPVVLSALALIGAGLGLAGGLFDILVSNADRAGVFNNPIHFSGLMVLLGFVSLLGFETASGRWRYVFLAGPILGVCGVLLSGSRGPFMAAVALAVLFAPAILYWHRHDRWLWASLAALAVVLGAVLIVSPLGPRAAGVFVELASGVSSNNLGALDEGRVQMLSGAVQAFGQSPLWGHGWTGMMPAAEAFYPPDSIFFGFDHLHADLANFAVMAGALGVLAYGALIVAPIQAMLAVPVGNRRAALVVGGTASVGFLVLGLTNSMFGLLPQTVLYATLMGWLFLLQDGGRAKAMRA